MPNNLDLLKASVSAYKKTLEGNTPKDKADRISIQMAQEFNAIVEEVKTEAPAVASRLPRAIKWESPFARIGQADVKFLELEMMLNQVLAILDLLKADR